MMNAQNPTFSNSRSGSSSNSSSNSAGNILTSTDRCENNGSAPGLPGIGRGDGVGTRQPLRSNPDIIYNSVQTAQSKRARVFSPDAFCGPRATGLSPQSGAPGQGHASVSPMSGVGLEMPAVSSEPSREDDGTNVSYPAGGQSGGYNRAFVQHSLPPPAGHAGVENPAIASATRAFSTPAATSADASLTDSTDDNGAQPRQDEYNRDCSQTRMNLCFKMLLLRRIDRKMHLPGNWRWKTVKSAWAKGGIKEVVDEAYADWLALPPQERIKYGGDARRTSMPREGTFMQFLSQEKKYRHWMGGAK